jgi:hypothetical protein
MIILKLSTKQWYALIIFMFLFTHLFFHELVHYVHLRTIGIIPSEVCFLGFKNNDVVGWVRGESNIPIQSTWMYESVVDLIAFSITAIIFFIFLSTRTEVLD